MIQQVTKIKNFGVKRPNYNYTATFYEHIFHSALGLENLNMNSTAGMSQSLSHLSTSALCLQVQSLRTMRKVKKRIRK